MWRCSSSRMRAKIARSSSSAASSTSRRYASSAVASSATLSSQYRRNVWYRSSACSTGGIRPVIAGHGDEHARRAGAQRRTLRDHDGARSPSPSPTARPGSDGRTPPSTTRPRRAASRTPRRYSAWSSSSFQIHTSVWRISGSQLVGSSVERRRRGRRPPPRGTRPRRSAPVRARAATGVRPPRRDGPRTRAASRASSPSTSASMTTSSSLTAGPSPQRVEPGDPTSSACGQAPLERAASPVRPVRRAARCRAVPGTALRGRRVAGCGTSVSRRPSRSPRRLRAAP